MSILTFLSQKFHKLSSKYQIFYKFQIINCKIYLNSLLNGSFLCKFDLKYGSIDYLAEFLVKFLQKKLTLTTFFLESFMKRSHFKAN
jgi:hypothetical protein